jgi:hypothetical protein
LDLGLLEFRGLGKERKKDFKKMAGRAVEKKII